MLSLAPARLWSRTYSGPARPFEVVTSDGVCLRGHVVTGDAGDLTEAVRKPALVFCHGFLGWHTKAKLVRFQEELARWFDVYAFDFRGHGQSEGVSSFGAREDLDVDAVVRLARADGFERVVAFGGSMGGIAVIRHAALLGGVDAVVAVSTPARWDGHESEAVRRMARLAGTNAGRRMLRTWGTRTAELWLRAEEPADLVGRIAPTPLVLVHGRDDHYFDEEQAWELYRRAGSPKRLLLARRFGHAEDGYTPQFAAMVAAEVLGRERK